MPFIVILDHISIVINKIFGQTLEISAIGPGQAAWFFLLHITHLLCACTTTCTLYSIPSIHNGHKLEYHFPFYNSRTMALRSLTTVSKTCYIGIWY